MANTSSTGGYLIPSPSPAPAPLEDDALFDFFQEWFVGLTGIDPTLVRPRWQREVPNPPDETVTWLAFGIKNRTPDTNAVELHYSTPSSYNELRRHEQLEILVSVYGPNTDSLTGILRDGMQIAQNREVLTLNNFGFVSSGNPVPFPELIKNVWYRRTDMRIWVNRQIKRHYGIQDIASAHGTLNNDIYTEDIDVENNP
jgi:hypothetical protein